MSSLPLSHLKPGTQAVVEQLPREEKVASRLREMGVLPGTEVTFVRMAPLGDPLEIYLRGYSLSLRQSEAQQLLVQPIVELPEPGK
jgi:ferrous iron transport protein A